MARSELEAALRENPDDAQSWSVFGDLLASEGDARGQLIALELQAAVSPRPFDREVLRHQASELFDREHRSWLGPLADAGLEIVWRHGFAIEVTIARGHRATLSKLLELPTAALLRKLTFIKPRSLAPLVELLARAPLEQLELQLTHDCSLAPLAELPGLRTLAVDGGSNEGLEALAELPHLRELALVRGQGPLHALARGFVALRGLDLGARIQARSLGELALAPLHSLRGLSSLVLRDAGWFALEPLRELQALTHLDLRSTDIGDLSPLSELRTLESLRLSGCTEIGNLDALASLHALRRLDFSYTRVRRLDPLAGLRALELVELDGTPVHSLAPLFELPALRRVGIAACEIEHLQPLLDRGITLTGVRPREPSWREFAERALAELGQRK